MLRSRSESPGTSFDHDRYRFISLPTESYPPAWQMLSPEERLILCDLVWSNKPIMYINPRDETLRAMNGLKIAEFATVEKSSWLPEHRNAVEAPCLIGKHTAKGQEMIMTIVRLVQPPSLWVLHSWLLERAENFNRGEKYRRSIMNRRIAAAGAAKEMQC